MKRWIFVLIGALLIFSFEKVSVLLAIFTVCLLLYKRINVKAATPVVYFLSVPIGIGLVAGINNNTYLALKDAYYFLIPLIFLFLGSLLVKVINYSSLFKIVVVSGTVMSLLRLIVSVSYSGIDAIYNPLEARYAYGLIIATPVPIIALGILWYAYVFRLKLFSRSQLYFHSLLNVLGLYMFASRTYWLILLCFFMTAFFYKFRKNLFIVYSIGFFVLTFLLTIGFSVQDQSSNSFTSKMLNSISEITVDNYSTDEDINTKYRGYETFMAAKTFASGSLSDKIVGGFGKLIDLETYVKLAGNEMRYIPILHNGYLYLLVKTGIVGLLIYLYVFGKLIKRNFTALFSNTRTIFHKFLSGILLSLTMAFVITNYLVCGFFNYEMCVVAILIGYIDTFLRYYSSYEKKLLNNV